MPAPPPLPSEASCVEDSLVTTTFYSRFGKRALDSLLAAIGTAILSPILLIAAVAIKLTSSGPVFFRQLRTGQFGRPFHIFKFRSMFVQTASAASLVTASGDSRITPVGRFLRRSKIDELPQLLNILSGDMSFVGPRPEVPFYTDKYSSGQRAILEVKPGITCPSALALCPEEEVMALHADEPDFYSIRLLPYKIETDLAYFKAMTLSQDLSLILRTVLKVFDRNGPAERLQNGLADQVTLEPGQQI